MSTMRTKILLYGLASVLTLSMVPGAEATHTCTDTASAGNFSVGCNMSGSCPAFGPTCSYTIRCTLTFTGVASSTNCGGNTMACGLGGTGPCTGQGSLFVGPGTVWTTSCSASGTSLTIVTLSCSTT